MLYCYFYFIFCSLFHLVEMLYIMLNGGISIQVIFQSKSSSSKSIMSKVYFTKSKLSFRVWTSELARLRDAEWSSEVSLNTMFCQ